MLVVLLFVSVGSIVLGQSRDQTANGKEIKGAFTLARAMELVYGSYDYSRMASKWTPNQTRNYPDPWPGTIDVWPLMDMPYVESSTAEHLLITNASPHSNDASLYTCHNCSPLIGLVLFSKTSDGWIVERSDLQFGNYGEFGKPPSFSVQPVGPNRYGLLMSTSFGSTGAWERTVTVIVPAQGKFLKAFEQKTEESYDYNCTSSDLPEHGLDGCVAYDGGFEMVPNPQSEYYDLVLTKHVYRSFSQKSPVGTTITRYRFDGSKYVPIESSPNKPAKSPN